MLHRGCCQSQPTSDETMCSSKSDQINIDIVIYKSMAGIKS